MPDTTTPKLFFRLTILALLIMSLWVLSGSTPNKSQDEKYIPVKITRRLEPAAAGIPVEMRCGMAHLTAPNQLAGFDCTLKNNTSKSITATNAIYSIILERNGEVTKDTFNTFTETFGEPEFKGANKTITPGEEVSVSPPGSRVYSDAVIKGVEIGIDYIEFEDKSALGPDENGSHIIKDFRVGAAKYREWLNQSYKQGGKSVDTILPLLENDQSLPIELESLTPNQELGAKSYRNRLRNIYKKYGGAEVKKVLN